MNLKVSEIFYSLQGEGARAGLPDIFIRLSGCSAHKKCMAMGIDCDTEWESYEEISLVGLRDRISLYPTESIVWTGGEPLDQLTDEILSHFADYFNIAETSGIRKPPALLDYITVSPKVAEHIIERNFAERPRVEELRYVRHRGQPIPQPKIEADEKFISPHFDGTQANYDNIKHCIELVKQNPEWRLSIQQHKLMSIL